MASYHSTLPTTAEDTVAVGQIHFLDVDKRPASFYASIIHCLDRPIKCKVFSVDLEEDEGGIWYRRIFRAHTTVPGKFVSDEGSHEEGNLLLELELSGRANPDDEDEHRLVSMNTWLVAPVSPLSVIKDQGNPTQDELSKSHVAAYYDSSLRTLMGCYPIPDQCIDTECKDELQQASGLVVSTDVSNKIWVTFSAPSISIPVEVYGPEDILTSPEESDNDDPEKTTTSPDESDKDDPHVQNTS